MFILTLTFNLVYSQTKSEINSLINEIAKTRSSAKIIETIQAKRIISHGESNLAILSSLFNDITKTKVKSSCQDRRLTKGEIAIILADRIEMMPYARLTGIQNCLLSFCKNSPNFVEYYLDVIKRDGIESFQKKYQAWLIDDKRKEWTALFKSEESKK